jgi:hypothetical protein
MLMSGVTLDHANAPPARTNPTAAAMTHLGRRTTTSSTSSPGRIETIGSLGGGVLDRGRTAGSRLEDDDAVP